MAKILILIIGHLCNAPRPQKEAQTLAEAGYDVTVGGVWFDSKLAQRDRLLVKNKPWKFEPIVDFRPHNRWQNLVVRAKAKIAKEVFKRWQIFSPELLGYGAREMLKTARKTKADLTIVHSEVGLWVGNRLLDEGFRVGIDFEDWFSEDLLPEARLIRPIKRLKHYEARLAKECQYCLATSNAMAESIAQAYDVPKPEVIYNTFSLAERTQIDKVVKDRQDTSIPSLHWFSQTIGVGRGLENLFAALNYVQKPIEIHLRGNYSRSHQQLLEPLIPPQWRERVFIHPTVDNQELLSRIAEHDIGVALELKNINNRNLTITNKLFQYLQGGLTIVATDTLGQKEILSQYSQLGSLIPDDNPLVLADTLNQLLQDEMQIKLAKKHALQTFENSLSWETQKPILLKQIEKSLSTTN